VMVPSIYSGLSGPTNLRVAYVWQNLLHVVHFLFHIFSRESLTCIVFVSTKLLGSYHTENLFI
jgi:hypothetical protein